MTKQRKGVNSMNNKSILVVTRNQTSAHTLSAWTKIAHPFHVTVVQSEEEAIESCHLLQYDLVVVDGTDDSIDAKKLSAIVPILQDEAILLVYDGEELDRLTENVEAIFHAKKYKRILNMLMLEPGEKKWNIPQFSLN